MIRETVSVTFINQDGGNMLQFRPLVKLFFLTLSIHALFASDDKLDRLKTLAANDVEDQAKLIQVMVDKIYSFGELGFQEVETSKYLTEILENNGFRVEKGISGIPTAWMAEWGKGKPVIALGSDIDGIPKSSQKPGVAFHDPIIEGAPGHGEGHNSGQAVIVAAAIVVKNLMEKEDINGTVSYTHLTLPTNREV